VSGLKVGCSVRAFDPGVVSKTSRFGPNRC